MPTGLPNQRLDIVNTLRAFAALWVAWGHLSYGQTKWLNWSGRYGYTGVYIFFVISGFIIPYSLYRSGYHPADFVRFIGKRCIRLYPPYLVSIPITLLAANVILPPIFHRGEIHVTGRLLVDHLFYLNDFVGAPWINTVYWTLAIEFQWYLVAGLLYGLFASRSALVRFVPVALAMAAYFLTTGDRVISHTLPIFLIGVFVFQYKAGLIGWRRLLCLMAVMVWAMRWPTGWLVASLSAATGLLIAFCSFRHRIADFLGNVSYSVYLLHLPVGVSIVGWLSHSMYGSGSYIGVLDMVGLLASIGAAVVLYRWVEKPAQDWSSRIRFVKGRSRREVVPILREGAFPVLTRE